MFKRIIKYFQMPWTDRLLLAKTFMLLGSVRLALLVTPFRILAAFLGRHMEESPYYKCREVLYIHRISWAIELMSCYTPWESKCLVQAITGKILLRRKRLPNTLYLGLAKDQNKQLIAHAWLRSGKDTVTGAYGRERFTITAKFTDYY